MALQSQRTMKVCGISRDASMAATNRPAPIFVVAVCDQKSCVPRGEQVKSFYPQTTFGGRLLQVFFPGLTRGFFSVTGGNLLGIHLSLCRYLPRRIDRITKAGGTVHDSEDFSE